MGHLILHLDPEIRTQNCTKYHTYIATYNTWIATIKKSMGIELRMLHEYHSIRATAIHVNKCIFTVKKLNVCSFLLPFYSKHVSLWLI